MKSPRLTCENQARCGATGHYMENGGIRRCPCLEIEIVQRKLGEMYTPTPKMDSPLRGKLDSNLRIEGPLSIVRPHVAGALMHASKQRVGYVIIDAYRLIEIFLEKDTEFATSRPAIDADLLIILLGFGDPRNRYLPELLVQAFNRRELTQKPTWVILGLTVDQITAKYSADLEAIIRKFQVVNTK